MAGARIFFVKHYLAKKRGSAAALIFFVKHHLAKKRRSLEHLSQYITYNVIYCLTCFLGVYYQCATNLGGVCGHKKY